MNYEYDLGFLEKNVILLLLWLRVDKLIDLCIDIMIK